LYKPSCAMDGAWSLHGWIHGVFEQLLPASEADQLKNPNHL